MSTDVREEGMWELCSIFTLGIDFVYWKVNTNMNSDTYEETREAPQPIIFSRFKLLNQNFFDLHEEHNNDMLLRKIIVQCSSEAKKDRISENRNK